MICICVLASGSKGNAVFLASPDAKILIDAGLSGKEIERKMGEIGFSPQELDAILVSHEHRDHVLGVGVLYRRFGTPVYITTPTLGKAGPIIGKVKGTVEINPGSSFLFRDLKIYPFEVPHDAVNPINFIVTYEGVKIGIATDLGFAPNLVKQNLKGCRALIVETNHDREMLENGPYPWPLKQRVKGRHGHLSNEQGARLLYDVYSSESSARVPCPPQRNKQSTGKSRCCSPWFSG